MKSALLNLRTINDAIWNPVLIGSSNGMAPVLGRAITLKID